MIRIALLRHFPTDWNETGRLQGRSDRPLSACGRTALAARRLPDAWRGLGLLTSPLARARMTAEGLAEGAPVTADPRLTEMDFGAWEGAEGAALLADPASGYCGVEGWGWDFRPPGGESPAEVAARVAPVLAGIDRPCVIVTHRGVIRVILALATGWEFRGSEPFRVRKAALIPVTLGPGGRPVAADTAEPLAAR